MGCGLDLTMRTMNLWKGFCRFNSTTVNLLRTLIVWKDKFQCSYCSEWHDNGDGIIWCEESCGQCCRKCVQKVLDAAIPRKKLRIGIRGKCIIPQCSQCGGGLSVVTAKEIGATDIQLKVLNQLIEVQGSGKSKDNCIVM